MKYPVLLMSRWIIHTISLSVIALWSSQARVSAETRYAFFSLDTSEHLATLGLSGQHPYELTDVTYLEFTSAGDARFGFGTGRIEPQLRLHHGDPRVVEENPNGLMAETNLDTIWRDNSFPIQVGFGIRNVLDRFDKPGVFRTDGTWVRSVIIGDLTDDGQVDIADIDQLQQAIINGSTDAKFDLNVSGKLDLNDLQTLVVDQLGTWIGDANLDDVFNHGDIVDAFIAGEYRDDLLNNSTWATGDWNADGEFTEMDLVAAFIDGGYNRGSRSSAAPVPEPNHLIALLGALGGLAARSRRQRH